MPTKNICFFVLIHNTSWSVAHTLRWRSASVHAARCLHQSRAQPLSRWRGGLRPGGRRPHVRPCSVWCSSRRCGGLCPRGTWPPSRRRRRWPWHTRAACAELAEGILSGEQTEGKLEEAATGLQRGNVARSSGTTREGGEVAALVQPGDVTSSKVRPADSRLRSGP
jgi:hypothetical protein